MTKNVDPLPVKRSKHFADNASVPKAAKEGVPSIGSKRKSPAKPAAAKTDAGKSDAAKPVSATAAKSALANKKLEKSAPKGRKAIVIDDSDDDFQVCLHHADIETSASQTFPTIYYSGNQY